MKHTSAKHTARSAPPRVSRGQMLAATSAFLVLALLALYGFIHLLRLFAQRELSDAADTGAPQAAAASPAPVSTPIPMAADMGLEAAFPLDQSLTELSEDETILEDSESSLPRPTEAVLPAASPEPTPLIRAGTDFSRSRMDVVLLGFDGSGYLDTAALMALRKESCTFLFLPGNLIDGTGLPLSRLRSCEAALAALETVLPLDLDRYVYFETNRIGDCVDGLGGIGVDGVWMDGAAAQQYSADDGADSLIRLSRLQALTKGAAAAFRQVSFFRLGNLKDTLLEAGGGSLTKEEYLSLYLALRALEEEQFHTCLLPVDSLSVEGLRCYQIDLPATVEILESYYRFS